MKVFGFIVFVNSFMSSQHHWGGATWMRSYFCFVSWEAHHLLLQHHFASWGCSPHFFLSHNELPVMSALVLHFFRVYPESSPMVAMITVGLGIINL